jgi:hypothetical protein
VVQAVAVALGEIRLEQHLRRATQLAQPIKVLLGVAHQHKALIQLVLAVAVAVLALLELMQFKILLLALVALE